MKFNWHFLNFSLLLILIAFLNKFFNIAFDIVPERSIWNLLYRWIPFKCKTIALTFGSCPNSSWASLIIVCCRSVEEITRLVLLYINCPWSKEKIYKPFESWFSYLYIPLHTMDKCFYVSTFQFLQN